MDVQMVQVSMSHAIVIGSQHFVEHL